MLCHNPAIKEKIFQMDSIDRKILAELQADGRLSITDVVTRDLPAFQKLYDDKLSAMPGVQHLRSTLVMKTVVQDRPFPLETLNASR
ncbi:hypothetical protein CJ207_26910 [Klebsiella aerogenes]|nr:hypothetical protein CJ207_26910 [Klebsiella aerogenes]